MVLNVRSLREPLLLPINLFIGVYIAKSLSRISCVFFLLFRNALAVPFVTELTNPITRGISLKHFSCRHFLIVLYIHIFTRIFYVACVYVRVRFGNYPRMLICLYVYIYILLKYTLLCNKMLI